MRYPCFLRSILPCLVLILILVGFHFRSSEWWDLPKGDTSYYWLAAGDWNEDGAFSSAGRLTFSPLYCAYLGSVAHWFPDAPSAVFVHRFLILSAVSIGVWFALNRILTPFWAWMGALWWIALPTNWRAMFEVHLFGFGLILVAAGLAGVRRSALWHGLGLAFLVLSAFFVRNEFIPAVFLFAGYALWDILRCSENGPTDKCRNFAMLASPSFIAILAVLDLFSGNPDSLDPEKIASAFTARQRINLQQVYAFGYSQRNPLWKKDPWTQGASLLEEHFGRRDATFFDALKSNPKRIWEHMSWNLSLVPDGLQLALFGHRAGPYTPDFADGNRRPGKAIGLTIALALVWVIGFWCIYIGRDKIPTILRNPQIPLGTWMILLSCVPSCVLAIVSQRPRPSYIFPLSLLLMACTLWILGRLIELLKSMDMRGVDFLNKLRKPVTLFLACGIPWIIVVKNQVPKAPHPLRDDYAVLSGIREKLDDADTKIAMDAAYAKDLLNYLAPTPKMHVTGVPIAPLASEAESIKRLADIKPEFLFVHVDIASRMPHFQSLEGWRKINGSTQPTWQLWERSRSETLQGRK